MLTCVSEPILPLSKYVTSSLDSPKRLSSWDWINQHAVTHKGDPFDGASFPYLKGIADAWDDPRVRRIAFRACSRVGKTEINLALHACAQHHDPDTGMIVTPTERLLQKTIKDRLWPSLELNSEIRSSLPPKHLRAATKCRTSTFITHGAWSGSPVTLGDLDPKYLHLLEVSKFSRDDSDEADTVELTLQRGSEIVDRKVFMESTPTLVGTCAISRYVEAGTNRHYFVPCPHCGDFSPLEVNQTNDRRAGGLWWEKDKDGRTTPARAYRTATYVCPHCTNNWGDEHRLAQIRKGVWVAPGEVIDRTGTVTGTPHNDGPDESFNLNRLYAPTFTFGDVAKEYVTKIGTEHAQDLFNGWLGLPYAPIRRQLEWEDLAKRLCVGGWNRGTVPEQCFALTVAIDVQIDHFVCVTLGFCPNKVGYLIDFGRVTDWQGVKEWTVQVYDCEDGGTVSPMLTLIDAKDGNRKDEIVDACRDMNNDRGPFVWPSMGQNPKSFNGSFFQRVNVDSQNHVVKKGSRQIDGLQLVKVGTAISQDWLNNCLFNRKPGERNSIIFPAWAAESRSLHEQLLNECWDAKTGLWTQSDRTTPVDFRDAVRYARVGIETYVGGDWAMNATRRRTPAPTKRKPVHEGVGATVKRITEASRPAGSSFIRKPRYVVNNQ
ncbi:terminase gpA endonuclease subunit [Stieleria magnilauensis]|uniref:Phage terminase large subunit (GpA) n=1 Tax=Stieleria magnilauensis TaxID=2527963 RepID=A0ABX5XZD9_9BACT|nr:Phage terminase large subunit (GpA) [Planctomycetes bacterium TBK1r]